MKGSDLAGAWRTFRCLKKSVTAGGSDRSIRAVNNSSCSDWFVVKGRLVALRSEGKTKIINKTVMQAGRGTFVECAGCFGCSGKWGKVVCC